ncbi:MAG: cytochrome c biogenesis protein CcsA, partial [Deltaproteobacteria bacterium]|nr:cytochrome c biogenesis protein CcsA [Deltaproteobacteria bacterium]
MIALLGRTVLHTAIVLAVLGAALGWAGGGRTEWARRWAARMALAFALAMLATNLLLEVGLLQRDFSLSYVAQVGSRQVPDWVAAASLWSALDGSLLFFGLLLSGFAAVFALRHRGAGLPPSRGTSTALAVLLSVGAGFALLSAVAASPFGDVLPPAPDGPGPNPLLQNHVLMAIHPPVLYLGYVGLAVPFALAAAALREGRLDRAQLASLRSWLLVAWVFLTAGIALGARWAYDVLGWGGYWSWDPVENASLMPWLVATSALHSLRRLESRGGSPIWPLAQVQAAFA